MPDTDPRRLLIVQPSWVGDAVMATPTLRAIRRRFPVAHIDYLLRRPLKPLYVGLGTFDRLITVRPDEPWRSTVSRVRAGRYDLAVVLPNSFRTAAIVRLAGVRRVLGYARDGRSWLLTGRLRPPRRNGRLVPVSTVGYYLELARTLGGDVTDRSLHLGVTPRQRDDADAVLRRAGVDVSAGNVFAGHVPRPLRVILNPGAQYGAAKLWPAERYGRLADLLVQRHHAGVLLSGAPGERAILDDVIRSTRAPIHDLAAAGVTLGSLKPIVRDCDLMITNDTGPRHLAAAFGVPCLTLYGPTDPAWTTLDTPRDLTLRHPVPCSPCQLKVCPLVGDAYHACMKGLTVDVVADAAAAVLRRRADLLDRHADAAGMGALGFEPRSYRL